MRGAGDDQASADHLLGMDQAVGEVVGGALHRGEVIRREHGALDDARAQIGQELGETVEDALRHLVAQSAAVLARRLARKEEAVGRRDVEAVDG
jgi:hypothetical protein